MDKEEFIKNKIRMHFQKKNKEECIKRKIKQYHQKKNKEECIKKKIIESHKEKNKEECVKKKIIESHQDKNKEECIKKNADKYYKETTQIKKQIDIYRKLANDDVIYQILNNLACRINKELKKRNIARTLTYMEFLGCSAKDFKNYLADKFIEGMDYDNYGEWQVDHIYPVSKIDFSNKDQIKKYFNYTNLQPLWAHDNKSKFNKI